MPSSMRLSHRPRVHILGLGSIGTFTAHGLLETPKSPAVTLLLHRESLYESYRQNGNKILLETLDGQLLGHRGYDTEVYRAGSWYCLPASKETTDKINHLIVSVKATQTTTALRALKNRLSAKSTILFLQNGCGMIDAVNKSIFPDPSTRPNYIVGVVSHGVTLNSPFHVTHTGAAAISLGAVPPESGVAPSSEREYLLSLLPQSPRLNATAYPYAEVLQIQLEKLAVNAFCNPLCALHNAQNGFLFTLPELRRQILTEVSNVVMMLPELRHIRGVQDRFAVDKLEATVIDILTKTAETTCSMVWDLRAGRETEIRFINGYWVRRGKEVGVPTPVNERLMEQVMSKGG
ncbi:probable 2-dehydropantoate 2-reductase [Aspergillus udagawae]|uniref:2-dehydropantoate 2-reductase n=1 Tax=Aspergillus udagawae TaxID=91492 RepID=A0ABQ1AMU8_9EURO|nr:probable 2-dehydropantoate 2-reductase [Aspergillus udagawae]GFF84821.1 probable 2-dehydropantoate 2-reductase [Aspergillus udagawae]GFG03283.1 probable 2-dehydropantoate 2-reductase [Aspergillus udagawae]